MWHSIQTCKDGIFYYIGSDTMPDHTSLVKTIGLALLSNWSWWRKQVAHASQLILSNERFGFDPNRRHCRLTPRWYCLKSMLLSVQPKKWCSRIQILDFIFWLLLKALLRHVCNSPYLGINLCTFSFILLWRDLAQLLSCMFWDSFLSQLKCCWSKAVDCTNGTMHMGAVW